MHRLHYFHHFHLTFHIFLILLWQKIEKNQQKDMEAKCLSYDRTSGEVSSSSITETSPKKPNLEFTLGRP